MSHELDDNIERRKTIVITLPGKGLSMVQILQHIMSFGYNDRGAKAKLRELKFLGMVEERDGKWFARKS